MKKIGCWFLALCLLLAVPNARASGSCAHDGGYLYVDAACHACALCGAKFDHTIAQRVVKATCSTVGYTMDVCTQCTYEGTQYDIVPVSKDAHVYGEWTVLKAATCQQEGLRERVCTLCEARQQEAIAKSGHTMVAQTFAPTCMEDGYTQEVCSVCGAKGEKTDIVAHSAAYHQWSEFTVLTPPGCETKGEQERVCLVCGATHKQDLPATGHSTRAVTVAATSAADGYTVDICSVCGKEIGQRRDIQHVWSDWRTTVEPLCEVAGERTRACSVCGAAQTEALPPLGHTVKEGVKAPTCVEDGYSVLICSACGKEAGERYDIVPASEKYHKWDLWEEISPATCAQRGEWINRCSICGAEKEVTSPMLAHRLESVTYPATFTQDGYTAQVCSVCSQEVGPRTRIVPAGMYDCEMSETPVDSVPAQGARGATLRTAVSDTGESARLLALTPDDDGHIVLNADDPWFTQNDIACVELNVSGLSIRVSAAGQIDVRVGMLDSGEGYELISVLSSLSNEGFDEALGFYDREGAYRAEHSGEGTLALYGRELVVTLPDRPCVAIIAAGDAGLADEN